MKDIIELALVAIAGIAFAHFAAYLVHTEFLLP